MTATATGTPAARPAAPRTLHGWEWLAVGAVALAGCALRLKDSGTVGQSAVGLAMLVLLVVWGAIATRVARRRSGLERRAWSWLAGAVLGALGGGVAFLAVAAWSGDLPTSLDETYLPSGFGQEAATSVLTLAIYGAAFVAVLHLARLAGGRDRTVDLVLDSAIGAGSLFFIVWSAAYRDIYQASALDPLTRGLVIAYPVLDSALLVLAFMAFVAPAPGRPRAYGLLALAFLCITLGDTAGAYVTLKDPAAGVVASLVAQTIAMGLLVLASLAILRSGPWRPAPEVPVPFWVQLLPIWPFSVAILAAIEAEREHGALAPIQFWTAVLVLALLMVRLLLALVQNRRLNESLARSSAFKTELLRFVSHEIANPLSPLSIELGIVRAQPEPERKARAWQVVDRSLDRLTRLSADVRDMALAETQSLVKTATAVDLADLSRAACLSCRSVAEPKGIAVECQVEDGLRATVDAQRISQVLDNLLSNAVKFTPDGGRIRLEGERREGSCVLRVLDTGVGFTQAQAEALFRPFSRPNAQSPGLGLGLYLCRNIVAASGGTLTASSPGPGAGATFEVRLPARP